jgi:hypothetical protein
MVSRRAARMHARTPVRRYSTVAILPAERPLQGLHWRSRSYGNGEMGRWGDGDGNDSAGLEAERKQARG